MAFLEKRKKYNSIQSGIEKIFRKDIDNLTIEESFAIEMFTKSAHFIPHGSALSSRKYALYDVLLVCSVYAGELLARKLFKSPSFDRRAVFLNLSKFFNCFFNISDKDIQHAISSRVPIIEDIIVASPVSYRNIIMKDATKKCIDIVYHDLYVRKMGEYDSNCTVDSSTYSNAPLAIEISYFIESMFSFLEKKAEQVPYYTDNYTGRES